MDKEKRAYKKKVNAKRSLSARKMWTRLRAKKLAEVSEQATDIIRLAKDRPMTLAESIDILTKSMEYNITQLQAIRARVA